MTRLSNELATLVRKARRPGAPTGAPERAVARLDDWEQALIAIVDPDSPRLHDRGRPPVLVRPRIPSVPKNFRPIPVHSVIQLRLDDCLATIGA